VALYDLNVEYLILGVAAVLLGPIQRQAFKIND
jgi:hypothetical protein